MIDDNERKEASLFGVVRGNQFYDFVDDICRVFTTNLCRRHERELLHRELLDRVHHILAEIKHKHTFAFLGEFAEPSFRELQTNVSFGGEIETEGTKDGTVFKQRIIAISSSEKSADLRLLYCR